MSKKKVEDAPIRFGNNLGMILDLHDMYLKDPNSVSEEMRYLFEEMGTSGDGSSSSDSNKVKGLLRLLDNIRLYGHLQSDIFPIYKPDYQDLPSLILDEYGITESDLKRFPAALVSTHLKEKYDNAYEAIVKLRQLYTGSIAYEYMHISDLEERQWIKEEIETDDDLSVSNAERKEIFKMLARVEGFEKYLHKNFVGAKRFSIEGVDSIVPMLDHLLGLMAKENIPNLQIGMAHRGRLNVLTHILQKPYEMMLSEFSHTNPLEFLPEDGSLEINVGWFKDVKYHLGATKHRDDKGIKQSITLANNPSHLEVVGPVVLGKTRAEQDDTDRTGLPHQDYNQSLAVVIHGDSAFPGQGVVYETLNLSQLDGFNVGGTIHIIANNRIGFTTEEHDARSTVYSTGAALGFDIPVIHVNADKPEEVIKAVKFALKYRQKFNKDIVIDVIGYRRYGHNEMDEPMTTNPTLYQEVKEHSTIEHEYGDKLVEDKVITRDEKDSIIQEVYTNLKNAHDKIDKDNNTIDDELKTPEHIINGYNSEVDSVEYERLKEINDDLLKIPENFEVFKKLKNVLNRRLKPFEDKNAKVDWAHAEALAFGTILQDGTAIRLTGQDSERGTFAQRHAVLHDPNTGQTYYPLHHVSNAKATFEVHNSPLSEAAVVGFDYGYNVHDKDALVIWEAQYGDFANMAQVYFDNFLFSGNAKWGESSGMTLLLPHAQEGQGPEHSSGRIERFLQLAAENNMTVANLTSASNYYYLLRRQAKHLNTDVMKPLVIMTPKSLLRNETVSDPVDLFTNGQFKEIIVPKYNKSKVKTVIIASGKVAVDVLERYNENPDDEILIIRLEQLYPFPSEQIKDILNDLRSLKEIRFVQEEPQNMGAYQFVLPYLIEIKNEDVKINYVGRIKRASPAEGSGESYKLIQNKIIEDALKNGGENNE